MPQTAADWLMMLLSGGALSGAGLMLRRKVG
jgi:LPXTG-motif cell wall-anchored protein